MQIRMDKENRELKAHGSDEFPVNISYEQLSRYERGSFSWHWHPEIELTFVLSGQIGYQVNGKSYILKEGDGIFCNTNALHSGHMIDGMDCVYISTTFAPRFLYGFSNSVIQTRYVEPVLTDMQLNITRCRRVLGFTGKRCVAVNLNPDRQQKLLDFHLKRGRL